MVNKDVALKLKMVNTINFITNSLILLVFCTGLLMCIIGLIIKIANYFKPKSKKKLLEVYSEKTIFIGSKSSINTKWYSTTEIYFE
jgi:hypothetical protein